MDLHAIGIDLGKTIFHLVGLSRTVEVVARKKFSRTQLLRFTSEWAVILPRSILAVGLNSCACEHAGSYLRSRGSA